MLEAGKTAKFVIALAWWSCSVTARSYQSNPKSYSDHKDEQQSRTL